MHRCALVPCLALAVALAAPTMAGLEDFSGYPAGTVIAGTLPQGGSASGTAYPGFTVTNVINNGGGPASVIVFDSANPTGNDPDLGSPNQTCPGGGPGVGTGGELGMPGENCVPLGNLLIVPENINDGNTDNIVDNPNDEAGGSEFHFEFDNVVVIDHITIMDIDSETAQFVLEDGGVLQGTVNATDLGNNSAQVLDLTSYGEVTCLEITFSSSGAIAEIEFHPPVVPVQETSWGSVKVGFASDK